MKRQLIMFVAVGALCVFHTAAIAQNAGPKGRGQGSSFAQGEGRLGTMLKQIAVARKEVLAQLKLTGEQKDKIKALDAKNAKKLKELMQSAKAGAKPELREKYRAIMKEQREDMKLILTKEQGSKFQELMRAKMKELRDKAGKGATPNKP